MPMIIEWKDPGEDEIVYRFPIEEIEWGSQLIVHEYEAAVFFRDGKAYDVFTAGRHTITTLNLTLLTRVLSRIAGFDEVPFKATIIFVSLKQFQGKFGAKAQTIEYAPLYVRGEYWFKIHDPSLFVNKVVGGNNAYVTSQVNDYLRAYFNEKMITELSKYSLATVFTRLREVSFNTKNILYEAFRALGIELVDIKVESVDTDPEWRDRIFYLKAGGVGAGELLRMETMQKAAESLGKSSGAGLGAGFVLMQGLTQPYAPPAPQPPQVLCPRCGSAVPANANYCSYCGFNLREYRSRIASGPGVDMITCPNCKATIPKTSRFCPNCGFNLSQESK